MSEGFPTTPRAPKTVRFGAIAIALVALALAARTTMTSVAYVLRCACREREVVVPNQRFGGRDWFLLHGVFLLKGAAFLGTPGRAA